MTNVAKNSQVDSFLSSLPKWREEFSALREIILPCGLDERLKWGKPCYALENRNIVLIHGFKDYCALLFFKGALMKDDQNLLVQQTENVQAGRQIRFTGLAEIKGREIILKQYIHQAVEIEKSGLKVDFKAASEFQVPEEFRARCEADAGLKTAFDGLSPGRRKAYLLHFSAAKQSKTREARIEKWIAHIYAAKGLDD